MTQGRRGTPSLSVPAMIEPLAALNLPMALQTAGDAADGALPFGLTMAGLQQGTLVYLGLSSLVFVAVWVLGYLRR